MTTRLTPPLPRPSDPSVLLCRLNCILFILARKANSVDVDCACVCVYTYSAVWGSDFTMRG